MRSWQAPFFEKLVGDSAPQEKRGAHYVSRSFLKKMFNVLLRSHLTLHLDRLSFMKNNYTFDGLRRVCKQKTEMYTTWPIGWFNFILSSWRECWNLTRFCFSISYALCTVENKMTKKWKKKKFLHTYLFYFFGACNSQCSAQTYFHTVEPVLVTNMWNK